MKSSQWLATGAVAFALSLATAHAECPTTPDDAVCKPWSAMFLPTAFGSIFLPRKASTYIGGGVEAILIAWSDNSAAFGPSQGRVRIDFAVLRGTEMDAGTMVKYRIGAQVAFERNASRSYAIPYFTADLGGLWTEATGRRWFVDAGLGVYLIHLRSLILDAEVTGLLPFHDPDTLGGLTSRLALSFALW